MPIHRKENIAPYHLTVLLRAVLFISFSISLLQAQINPPDLRCVEVLTNGDVKLTWLPPADPGNFFSYEVYMSTQKNGPFTLVPSTLTSITATNFLHAGASNSVQSFHYFVVSTSGAGGVTKSGNSDTLRTIFLNSFKNVTGGTQDLQYNGIHLPKLPSTAPSFTISKEYPLGTWNILAITSSTLYPDTIWVCRAFMNYRISLSDGAGCISASNLLKGEYENSKDPEQPYVDSISVLPNGNTVLGWQVPLDGDINQYEIQYRTPANINDSIDTMFGKNKTSYTYQTTSANSGTVGIFVKAVDSCGRGSSVFYEIATLFLRTRYNQCAYQTTLNWNPYQWAKIKGVAIESTLEYRIYHSVNGSALTQIDATSDTFYVHKNVAPGKTVCYFIRVINTKKNITASSNRVCFFSTQVQAPNLVYIKSVSILDSKAAQIKIRIDTTKASTGVTIQRSENDTVFKNIAFIPSNGNANYTFIDNTIKSAQKSHTYRTIVIDSCGNERDGSNLSKTILLKVLDEKDQFFIKKLTWNAYEGFAGGVSGYGVYRIVNDKGQTSLLGYTDAQTTSYTDNIEGASDKGADIEYKIQAFEGIGNPYGIMETSFSNETPVYMEGNLYIPNAFAPAGVNPKWLPICYFVDHNDYRVTVFNRWGKKVFETTHQDEAWDGLDATAGVYVYLINYKNARGEYVQVKGSISLIR
jgi:hypothetical protein